MLDTKILALTLTALIVGVESQVTCSTSTTTPQCCWVVRSWQLMGQTTSVSSTSTTACCSMAGVTCDSTKTKVTGIYWASKGLSGSIPADVGNLTSLQSLDLARNQLSGSIPAEIGNLKNLTWLDLARNQLSGSIPAEIGNLKSLTEVYLRVNQLSGSIPAEIGNLKSLTELDLNQNKLSGSIPPEIGNLTKLTWLYLYNNKLSGSIPAEIGNLTSLTLLRLDSNQLSGSIPAEIGNLKNLTRLRLAFNQFSGAIPPEIGNFKKLTHLFLSNNTLTGSIPASIGNLINLTYLWLDQNPSLNGAFTPKCGINVAAGNTSVILCGCAAVGSPAFSFPPENTTAACLASSTTGGTLRKRAQVFSYMVDGNQYTCNNNTEGNPSQDCMNSLVFYCKSERLNAGSSFECKNRVDEMTRGLNGHWQTWRYRCSNPTWTFSSSRILTGITNCDSAIQNLKEKAKYSVEGAVIAVPDALIDSAKTLLWDRLN